MEKGDKLGVLYSVVPMKIVVKVAAFDCWALSATYAWNDRNSISVAHGFPIDDSETVSGGME